MNAKVRKVFSGWMSLSDAERRVLAESVREFEQGSEYAKRSLRESTRDAIMKMDTGPLGSGCPCCGRS
jgi:hypothetical protein